MNKTLEPQEVSLITARDKYTKDGETTLGEVRARVARALARPEADQEAREAEYLHCLEQGGFIPAGRILSAAGTDIGATLINCFVQPIADSATENAPGQYPAIYTALAEAAETMRRGGGVGYDFSRIRPRGAKVKGTNSRASGPVSFARVFDKSCETVESAGARRGAQMGVLRCDHPDIEDFITAKSAKGELNNFNLSVGVSDAFMQAVDADADFELVHKAAPTDEFPGAYQREDGMWVYRKVRARDIWEQIMRNTYSHAEPGVLFIDQMNAENNLYYCETIEATNPCAEQPLPPYGCCCLGSINLAMHVVDPFTEQARFDYAGFSKTVRTAVRMLDNVLDESLWPLEKQRQEAMAKRRIGLGFTALGSALVMLRIKYNSAAAREFAAKMTETMRDEAYRTSVELAQERGAFPLFDADKYLAGAFIQRLPEAIRNDIRSYGIRNSHLLSIAPTGTISLCFADNASNGIEPAFQWKYVRKIRQPDGSVKEYDVLDHAYRLYQSLGHDTNALPDYFVSALEMSAIEHMQMLEAVQPFVDSSISKTVNVPADYPYDKFQDLYLAGWKAGLKGLATYRPNDVLGSVLSVKQDSKPEGAAGSQAAPSSIADVNPLTKQIGGRREGRMTAVNEKAVLRGMHGKYSFYASMSFDTVTGILGGQSVSIQRPVEVFFPANQTSEGQQWITFLMMAISSLMRSGGDIASLLQNARRIAWERGQVTCGERIREDSSRVPLRHDSEAAALAYILQRMLQDQGYLDSEGNQVPVKALASLQQQSSSIREDDLEPDDAQFIDPRLSTGKRCEACGTNAVHKHDGCMRCEACGEIGSCS